MVGDVRDQRIEGRAAYVISQLYYYVAAVIGFGLFLGGAIAVAYGVRKLILPSEFETTRNAVQSLLNGMAFAIPGVAVMWWHLRQARRREGRPAPSVFWGRALYFHLVALVALIFTLVGGVWFLHNLADAAAACEPVQETRLRRMGAQSPQARYCYPMPEDALRESVDAGIILVVAGPVFWWHLRQGRRLTAPLA